MDFREDLKVIKPPQTFPKHFKLFQTLQPTSSFSTNDHYFIMVTLPVEGLLPL